MDDEKFRKLMGIGIFSQINAAEKRLKAFALPDAILNHNKMIEKAMLGSASISLAALMTSKRQNTAWDYITKQRNNLFMYDSLYSQVSKDANLSRKILGGSAISAISNYLENFNETIEKTNSALLGIQNIVTKNQNGYNSHLKFSKWLASSLVNDKVLNNLEIFSSTNYFSNKKLTPFDLLSGITFSNISNIFKQTGNTSTLENEFTDLQQVLSNNEDLVKEASEYISTVSHAEESYEKVEEATTNFIHKLMKSHGWSKQRSYNLAFVLSFLFGVLGKELLLAPFKSSESLPSTQPTYVTLEPSKNIDIVIKNSPVFGTIFRNTKKIGMIKENSKVEIIRMKEGWCYIEGTIEITKKIGTKLIKTDTVSQCWIKQHFLKNFQ